MDLKTKYKQETGNRPTDSSGGFYTDDYVDWLEKQIFTSGKIRIERGPDFSAFDLRCGNLLNYYSAEGDILPTVIEWNDLKWVTEDPKGFNLVHSPIELTENYLRLLGAVAHQDYWLMGDVELSYITTDEHFEMEFKTPFQDWKIKKIKYVHELQNLHYCLTGVMFLFSKL